MRLFAFDVDGTILPSGKDEISEPVIQEINKLLKRGDAVVIASGRPYTGIKPFLDVLGPGKKYAIGANGAGIYDNEGNVIHVFGMTMKDYYEFHERHKDWIKGENVMYPYLDDGIASFGSNWAVDWEIKFNLMRFVDLSKDRLHDDKPILKIMLATDDQNQIDLFKIDAKDKEFNILRSDPVYLEFVNKSADKGTSVGYLARELGVAFEDVYCFGDSGNDIGMLKMFNGVAMGNATEEAKRSAKYITDSAESDGVATFLKKLSKTY